MSEKAPSAPAPAYEEQPAIHQPTPISPMQPQNAYAPPTQQPYYPGMPHPSGYNTATPLHALQRGPAPADCPVCSQREMTRVETESGKTTHGWAAVLCCCCCLGCIPYLISSLKDVNHYCGKCGALLATWHNSGRVEVHQTIRDN